MAGKKAAKKKERKPLTLHKHYLVDIRRYAKDLGLGEWSFGNALETRITTRKGVKYLELRVLPTRLAEKEAQVEEVKV